MTRPKDPNHPRSYQRHGLHVVKRELRDLDDSTVGEALREWRAALVDDLGGNDAISTQQRALIDLACRTKLLVDSVDAFILSMPSPVNRQKRQLFNVVKERSTLVYQLRDILRDLGLERRARPAPTLQEYVAAKEREKAAAAAAAPLAPVPGGSTPWHCDNACGSRTSAVFEP